MQDCLFCKIIAGEIPAYKVYEDKDVLAFLDITPANPGHTLVVPKMHYKNLLELPSELSNKLIGVVKNISPAIIKGVGSTAFNVRQNNGQLAGQSVNHFHWHVIPRFESDGYELWPGKEYPEGGAEEALKKIKEYL